MFKIVDLIRSIAAARLTRMMTADLPQSLPGTSMLWKGPHTNPAANARRKAKRAIGHRQYRLQRKALARATRAAA